MTTVWISDTICKKKSASCTLEQSNLVCLLLISLKSGHDTDVTVISVIVRCRQNWSGWTSFVRFGRTVVTVAVSHLQISTQQSLIEHNQVLVQVQLNLKLTLQLDSGQRRQVQSALFQLFIAHLVQSNMRTIKKNSRCNHSTNSKF